MKGSKGSYTIEFAMCGLLFFSVIFANIEIAYLGFISSIVDIAQNESSRIAKNQLITDGNYDEAFAKYINNEKSIWVSFIDVSKFKTNVYYYKNIEDMVNDNRSGAEESPIAVYELEYKYQPILASFNVFNDITLSRSSFNLQEYERSEFLY